MKYLPFFLITINLSVLMVSLVCTKSHHHHHDHHGQQSGHHHGTIHKSRRVHPGHRMNPHQNKFMAVLYKSVRTARHLVCSATFIDYQHLLTAAHCVSNQSEWNHIYILPAFVPFDTENLKRSGTMLRRRIDKSWVHPRYSHGSEPYFDVAIIRTKKLWNNLDPLRLPLAAVYYGLYHAPFKAYGHVETDNTHAHINARRYKNAHVNEMIVDHFLPQAECVNHLHILWVIYDQYDMFCVANPTRTEPDPIEAGGPLIGHKANIGPVILGIRSVGNVHAYYYVNVTTMMRWIDQTLTTSRLQSQSQSQRRRRI